MNDFDKLRLIGEKWMGKEGREAIDDWIASTLAQIASTGGSAPASQVAAQQEGCKR